MTDDRRWLAMADGSRWLEMTDGRRRKLIMADDIQDA